MPLAMVVMETCPPDTFDSHAQLYETDSQRDADIIKRNADNGRWYRTPQSVKNSLHGNFEHHE